MTYSYRNEPLPILVSARVRLTQDQRKALKDAYYTRKNALQPAEAEGRGGLVVSTSYGGSNALDTELGMSQVVFADLSNSRDTISLNIILKLQRVLNVELVTPETILEACKSYCDYVFRDETE